MKKAVVFALSGAFLVVCMLAIFASVVSRFLGFSGDWPVRKLHSALD